ncbi:MAG: M48 family metalloprotease, partial [Burkholderiaceae bacterium]|nr:M48 family metalloprotease [Burkholderiaceae bacterium]
VNDAVVAVTRGALTRLTRDELQGVIGHEFSHILNGDMRLNMRLIGVLHGLLMVALFGRFLLELGRGNTQGDRRGGAAPLLAAGALLWVLGYVGVFFGRLIKAAVSRQREYLADAASVQFTRNRDGIGGALRKIGWLSEQQALGSAISHPNAETLSHMFLGAARVGFARGLFATHPPLAERLRRLYGRTVDFLPAPEQPFALAAAAAAGAPAPELPPLPFERAASPVAGLLLAAPAAEALAQTIGRPQGPAPSPVPAEEALATALADSTQAQLLVYGLLLDKTSPASGAQRRALVEALGTAAARRVDELHALAQALPAGVRLQLLDRALPTLRRLPAPDAQRLLALAHALIAADGRVSLPEFLLYTVLEHRLGADARRPAAVRYRAVAELAQETALVLSLVAALRAPADPERAFDAGLLRLPGVQAPRVPPERIAFEAVGAALRRLNALAPLAKPVLIKALAAAAFLDGQTNWKAASALRTICAALDSPLPPQLVADAAAPPDQ